MPRLVSVFGTNLLTTASYCWPLAALDVRQHDDLAELPTALRDTDHRVQMTDTWRFIANPDGWLMGRLTLRFRGRFDCSFGLCFDLSEQHAWLRRVIETRSMTLVLLDDVPADSKIDFTIRELLDRAVVLSELDAGPIERALAINPVQPVHSGVR